MAPINFTTPYPLMNLIYTYHSSRLGEVTHQFGVLLSMHGRVCLQGVGGADF